MTGKVFCLILAGGLATRLRPLTHQVPKALIPIAGFPLIERIMRSLEKLEFFDVCLALGHYADVIESFIASKKFHLNIEFTRSTLGTLEAVASANGWFTKGNLFIIFGDVFIPEGCLYRIKIEIMKEMLPDLLVFVSRTRPTEKPVYVLLDEKGRVIDVGKEISNARFFSSGMYVLRDRIFHEVKEARIRGFSHFSDFAKLTISKGYDVRAFCVPEVVDINNFKDLQRAEALARKEGV